MENLSLDVLITVTPRLTGSDSKATSQPAARTGSWENAMPGEPGRELDLSDHMQGCPLAAPLSTADDHLAGTAGHRPSSQAKSTLAGARGGCRGMPAEPAQQVLSALGSRTVGAHPRGLPPVHPCGWKGCPGGAWQGQWLGAVPRGLSAHPAHHLRRQAPERIPARR